jgi:hypothetical protein
MYNTLLGKPFSKILPLQVMSYVQMIMKVCEEQQWQMLYRL